MIWVWSLDGWILLTAMLCAVAATLLGNFLVLRRMSMLGDAISHAVLPGLAVAYFVSESRNSVPMFLGAVVAGILTAFFTEWVRRVGNVDEGASMGVVFTSLFALGLVMIVRAADRVDLDAGCVLYGAIELTPYDPVWVAGHAIPRAVLNLSAALIVNAAFVGLFYKELKLTSFDPALATTTGFRASLMHYALMTLVAVTAVASFESVGSVLVVAMFIVPPATAYLLTDRLAVMIGISVLIAAAAAVIGYFAAILVPGWFGYRSTTTAGMMAVAAGGLLSLAALFAPRHGIVIKYIRRRVMGMTILADDIVALLYRLEERDRSADPAMTVAQMSDLLLSGRSSLRIVLRWLLYRGEITKAGDQRYQLNDPGRRRAQNLVRSHRLWEQYLQDFAGLDAGRVHGTAERLEHFTDSEMRSRLDDETLTPRVDPHGKPIPAERPQP